MVSCGWLKFDEADGYYYLICADGEDCQKIGPQFDTSLFSDEYCKYGEFTGTMEGITCADRVRHSHYADFGCFEYIVRQFLACTCFVWKCLV